ncbi:hypothetical protein AK88_05665, partial [Plasmodium fragile]
MQNEEWIRVKRVLDEFVQHMQTNEHLRESLGANCDNSGWDDITAPREYYMSQTVADMIRCRLMSAALWFANQDDVKDEEVNRLRCEVANVFGYILKNMYCPRKGQWARGIEYAYTAMRNMGKNPDGARVPHGLAGPVVDGKCTVCGYKGWETTPGIINGDIAEWFVEKGIMAEIGKLEGDMPCEQDWRKYKKASGGTDHKVIEEEKIPEVKQVEKKVVEDTEKVIGKVKEKLHAEIEKGTKQVAGGGDKNGKKPSSTSPSPEGASGVATGTPSGQPRSDGAAGENRVTAAPVPVPQPPPPPPTVQEGDSGVGGKKEDVETVAPVPPKGDAKTDHANTPAGTKTEPKCGVTTQTHESSGVDESGNAHSVAVTFNITPTAPECSGSGTS